MTTYRIRLKTEVTFEFDVDISGTETLGEAVKNYTSAILDYTKQRDEEITDIDALGWEIVTEEE